VTVPVPTDFPVDVQFTLWFWALYTVAVPELFAKTTFAAMIALLPCPLTVQE
jgi:hypothetical protein